ncbi:MAG: T9SS type B sorting domain-containing protein [Flavobacteriales bacterium]|nr:T9SS type B sorting domain-containing protein [Flavobacteriales bacterium]MBT6917330.1 T9SS type B sorting domain-containing protein [Flavobacteriales bacterium]MBT7688495.1 T9SS type B sorting domain-containing protein [Flavobacteriales bacterium]
MRYLLTLIFCASQVWATAQSPADWWYFGHNAGVEFQSGNPVGVTDGQLFTTEGCASISDPLGDLLFYTDGSTVWDKLHNIMPNGLGLLGNSSATQSAIIVPAPGNPDEYYIITSGINSSIGVRSTLVDMTLNGGLGDVVTTSLNVLLTTNSRENIAAVSHSNGLDYWVIMHQDQTDSVKAFHVSSSGINLTPVVSLTGQFMYMLVGSIKASPNGDYVACGSQTPDSKIKIMRFDNATGQITDSFLWESFVVSDPYGIEFSPDSKVLYVSDGWGQSRELVQYNVSVWDSAAIVSSEYLVEDSISNGQIQLGPDQRIYLTSQGFFNGPVDVDSFLHRINNPNVLGVGCDFEQNAVYLEGREATKGLPPFIASFFNASFETSGFCFGDSTYFVMDTVGVDSFGWEFGDPNSGSQNTSTDTFPAHLFTDTGAFTITLIAKFDTTYDTVSSTIFIYPRQFLELGPDTTACFGSPIILDVGLPYSSYLWQDSSTADTFLVESDSLIWCTLFGVCDTVSDTINIAFDTIPIIDLGPDTTICELVGYVIDVDLQVDAVHYWYYDHWNDNDSVDTLNVLQTGLYVFFAENACGSFVDSVDITITPLPDSALLPPDTLNCFDSEIVLVRPINDSITYVWSDSSDSKTYIVDTTEQVWLAAFNDCGFIVDTINIIFNGEIQTELGEDTTICDEDSILLTTNDSLATFIWNSGDSVDSVWTVPGETFNYIVTITLRDCELREQREVVADELACPPLDCTIRFDNIFTPNGDGINDRFRINSDCNIFSYSLAIYNRWGQLIHYTINPAFGWDGFVNGEEASNGTYFYKLEYKDDVVINVDRYSYQGSFTLKR